MYCYSDQTVHIENDSCTRLFLNCVFLMLKDGFSLHKAGLVLIYEKDAAGHWRWRQKV